MTNPPVALLRLAVCIGLLLGAGCGEPAISGGAANAGVGQGDARERWPKIVRPRTAAGKIKAAQTAWRKAPIDWRERLPRHEALGIYYNYYTGACHGPRYLRDSKGVVRVKVGRERGWLYDPVLIAQCGLSAWGEWFRSNDRRYLEAALAHGRQLVAMQDESGALRYPFPWAFYETRYEPGWTSAMAQGQALSLYARLYHATHEDMFARAGTRALDYLLTPIAEGGVMTTLADLDPSLRHYVFFEEIVTRPKDNYILNGYMFTLLGLYDWSKLDPAVALEQKRAAEFFDAGIRTLEPLLPYYDLDGMTAYDLTHITANNLQRMTVSASYHMVHVHLLHALYSITQRDVLRVTRDKWGADLDQVARVGSAPP